MVLDAVDALPDNPDNKEEEQKDAECPWCSDSHPRVWTSIKSEIVAWDKSKHGHLTGNELPSNSTRQKFLYRQIVLIISGRPLGKGKNILLPNCARDGICDLLSGEEGNNMGHMEN
jgi:hypothetical protein